LSMHLAHISLSTTSTKGKKSKGKTIDGKTAAAFASYNKFRRQQRLPEFTIDQYINYISGKHKCKPGVVESPLVAKSMQRVTAPIVSAGMSRVDPLATSAKPTQKYTGTLVTGIATMHKSNAVPVINKKQAEEISSMRR